MRFVCLDESRRNFIFRTFETGRFQQEAQATRTPFFAIALALTREDKRFTALSFQSLFAHRKESFVKIQLKN
jgi:hypothetical protein